MLWKARESLENASCKKVRGFRAPCFSINKSTPTQYKIIEEVFDYDSSFICSSLNDIKTFQDKMELTNLKLIPLYANNIFGKSLRLGGSYLKIFPLIYAETLIKNAQKAGFSPHIYIHPYEFDNSDEFKISFADFKKLGNRKAFYWSMRQYQWLFYRNRKLKHILRKLIMDNPLEGNIESKYFWLNLIILNINH